VDANAWIIHIEGLILAGVLKYLGLNIPYGGVNNSLSRTVGSQDLLVDDHYQGTAHTLCWGVTGKREIYDGLYLCREHNLTELQSRNLQNANAINTLSFS